MRFAHHPTAGMELRLASWPIPPGRNSSMPPARPVSWASSPSKVSNAGWRRFVRTALDVPKHWLHFRAVVQLVGHHSTAVRSSVTPRTTCPKRSNRPRSNHSPTRYKAPSITPHAMLQPMSAISNCRAPSLPSSSMIIPAPSVKVSVMMRPKRISARLVAGSRYRCIRDDRLCGAESMVFITT